MSHPPKSARACGPRRPGDATARPDDDVDLGGTRGDARRSGENATDAGATEDTGDALLIIDDSLRIVLATRTAANLLRRCSGWTGPLRGRTLGTVIDMDDDALRSDMRSGLVITAQSQDAANVILAPAERLRGRSSGEGMWVLHVRDDDIGAASGDAWPTTVAILAHEIRNPLTGIIGSLKLLDAGAVGTVGPEAKPLVQMAMRNAGRVHALIDDVLAAETISAAVTSLEPVDVAEVVRQAVDAHCSAAETRSVRIRVEIEDEPVRVIGSAAHLERMLGNLLSNATKFSDAGGTVVVRVKRRPGSVRITVADTGPGIPQDIRPRVFEKFVKHDPGDGRNREGTGLGLAIVRAIVEEHSGQIGFASRPGETCFWVDLPEAVAEQKVK